MTRCEKCGKEVAIGDWPYCPHERQIGYGWHFGRFQNDARREKFHASAAENPFGHVSRD